MHASSSNASFSSCRASDRRRLSPSFPMRSRDLLRIDDGHAAEVRVQRGSVWITQQGDANDHGVERGGTFRLDRQGAVLVEAVTDAIVSVSWHGAAKPARLTLKRRGKPLRAIPEAPIAAMTKSPSTLGALVTAWKLFVTSVSLTTTVVMGARHG